MQKTTKIIAISIMFAGVFLIELLTPLGYVEWVLYFIPFIIASRFVGRLYVLLLSVLIIFLITIGFFLSPPGPLNEALSNRMFGMLAMGLMAYITLQRMRADEEIRHLAHHDPLTGLPNRRFFMDIADLELARARRSGKKAGILYLDLDGFKKINDTLGHEVGDKLLKLVAERLKAQIRKTDSVARMGGDEFNIVLSELNAAEEAEAISRKIISAFQQPFSINGREFWVTISLGASVYPDDSDTLEILLKNADTALYDAKLHGKSTFRFYKP